MAPNYDLYKTDKVLYETLNQSLKKTRPPLIQKKGTTASLIPKLKNYNLLKKKTATKK